MALESIDEKTLIHLSSSQSSKKNLNIEYKEKLTVDERISVKYAARDLLYKFEKLNA